jgi:hypothetical protein
VRHVACRWDKRYEVRQFNYRNSRRVSLGCWVRQTCVPKHVGHVTLTFTWTTDQMSGSFLSSRWSSTCPWYTVGGKMSDKNLEQRINIKSCVKIGKSASKKLALLTVAYGEWLSECHRRFKEGLEVVQDDPRSGQPKTQIMQMWTEYEPWCSQFEG